jgi:hypothetical protein
MDPGPLASGFTRALRDGAVVETSFPAATRAVTVAGVRGWLYPVTSRLGDPFLLFAWFDGSGYQVKVVEPDVESHADPHACHLFPDARLCLGEGGAGMPSLEQAYARSVVWANGFSVWARGEPFPF